LGNGEVKDEPSSRTSMMAMLDGGGEESTFEEDWERIILERSVEERRGRLATECIDIVGMRVDWEGGCYSASVRMRYS